MSGLAASLLLGSAHGVLLAILLRRRERNRRANRYLAALLGAVSLLLLDGGLHAAGVLARYPHLIGLAAWVPYALGPLVFLYVREMTEAEPARLEPPWRHFALSGAFFVLLLVTFLPRSASYKLGVAEHGNRSWAIDATEAVLVVHGMAYAIAALVRLRRHRAQVQELFSSLRDVSLRWLVVLAALNAFVWLAALVGFVVRMTGATDAVGAIVPLGSTVTIFVIGYFQLGQAQIYAPPPVIEAAPKPASTYQRARLADDDATELEARVRSTMTERKLYQRAGLTLAELADEVAATPHEVSQILSTRLGRNFYAFVNEHRIEHVQAGLRTTDRPVLDLAFEAGFQSKSTFNTAFRKATGMTPSEFRQRVAAEKH